MPILLRLAAARPRFVAARISLGQYVLIQPGRRYGPRVDAFGTLRHPSGDSASRLSPVDFTSFWTLRSPFGHLSSLRSDCPFAFVSLRLPSVPLRFDSLRLQGRVLAASRDEWV